MSITTLLLAGFGIWLLVEGALGALAPGYMRRLGELLTQLSQRDLAIGGLVSAAIGVALLALAVRTA